MTLYHGDLRKRKKSGGRKRPYRKWRRFESSGTRADTSVGEAVRASVKARGGNVKVKLLKGRHANVHDASGKTVNAEITSVLDNPAGADLKRRGIITRGAIIQTSIGRARVTSCPGQDGVVNAVLVAEG